jgi:hypothetical protein
MRERVSAFAGDAAKDVLISTFHSLGVRILREHGERLGLPRRFAIYDTRDQLGALKTAAAEIHIDDDAFDLTRVLRRISDWKTRGVTPEAAGKEVAAEVARGNRSDDYAVLSAQAYGKYEDVLRACGAVDFDDLLLLPTRLLEADEEVRRAVWRRWRWVMIDEYQDTNGVQLDMARHLAGARRNLCVVGDDDQSIYAFRGADVRNILEFERHFPGARSSTWSRTTGARSGSWPRPTPSSPATRTATRRRSAPTTPSASPSTSTSTRTTPSRPRPWRRRSPSAATGTAPGGRTTPSSTAPTSSPGRWRRPCGSRTSPTASWEHRVLRSQGGRRRRRLPPRRRPPPRRDRRPPHHQLSHPGHRPDHRHEGGRAGPRARAGFCAILRRITDDDVGAAQARAIRAFEAILDRARKGRSTGRGADRAPPARHRTCHPSPPGPSTSSATTGLMDAIADEEHRVHNLKDLVGSIARYERRRWAERPDAEQDYQHRPETLPDGLAAPHPPRRPRPPRPRPGRGRRRP